MSSGLERKVLTGPRRSLRTNTVLRWLRAGHQVGAYPFWSRVLVCAIPESVPGTRTNLDLMYGPGPWSECVFNVAGLRAAYEGRIRPGVVQIAVDDSEVLLAQALGVPQVPELVSMLGQHVTAGDLYLAAPTMLPMETR